MLLDIETNDKTQSLIAMCVVFREFKIPPRTTSIKKLVYILIENVAIIQTNSVCLLVSELSSAEYR